MREKNGRALPHLNWQNGTKIGQYSRGSGRAQGGGNQRHALKGTAALPRPTLPQRYGREFANAWSIMALPLGTHVDRVSQFLGLSHVSVRHG